MTFINKGVGSEFYENKLLFCICDIRGEVRTLYEIYLIYYVTITLGGWGVSPNLINVINFTVFLGLPSGVDDIETIEVFLFGQTTILLLRHPVGE